MDRRQERARAGGTHRLWNTHAARDTLTTVTLDAEAETECRRHTDA
ncbi:hypothetical protein [Candidatus Poriferisodalis sp.]